MAKSDFLSSQKLWRLIKEPDGYYYEIRLAGMTIDKFKVPEDSKLKIVWNYED